MFTVSMLQHAAPPVEPPAPKVCRNGHDQAIHGRMMHATPTRTACMRCMECRRGCYARENDIRRGRTRKVDKYGCIRGHSARMSVERDGSRHCLACELLRLERAVARVKAEIEERT